MNINKGDAHKKLLKKRNYCSTGMNTVINRLVKLSVEIFLLESFMFLAFLHVKIHRE